MHLLIRTFLTSAFVSGRRRHYKIRQMLHVYASARQEIEQRIEHRGEGDNSMVFYPEQGIAPEGKAAVTVTVPSTYTMV